MMSEELKGLFGILILIAVIAICVTVIEVVDMTTQAATLGEER